MSQKKRLNRGFASVLAFCVSAVAVLAMSGSALGDTSSQSQRPSSVPDNNVPYLAWVGEELKLGKCYAQTAFIDSPQQSLTAQFTVESWSGTGVADYAVPQVEGNTVSVSAQDGYICATGDVISLQPGLARIQLVVTDPTGQVVFPKHQFLAGWMTFNPVQLTELKATDFASTAQGAAAKFLGDPAGDGHFTAGGGPGILSAKVTGSMPLAGTMAGLIPGKTSLTMPADWAVLAQAVASTDSPTADPTKAWDIHDDQTDIEGHIDHICPPSAFTGAPAAPAGIDAVDNCYDQLGDNGPFSTVFGPIGFAHDVYGPYDPLRADTRLADGKLDAGDAPMPAARIDVTIAPNSGAAGDLTGVGYLDSANKTVTYSRDFKGDSLWHNLYAPYYDAYIPATTAAAGASGIDGPAAGNDFPGFLVNGQYNYWDIAKTLAFSPDGPSMCMKSTGFGPFPIMYRMPFGKSSVALYSDEHGEAQVEWNPGMGFYFNSLISNGSALLNANFGCDLQSLYNKVGALGSASISATARYPYKPVDFQPVSSASVAKDVTSLWSKTLAYFPKGPGAENQVARIVVAHAQDIDGSPLAHEPICFMSNAEGMTLFSGFVTDTSGNKLFVHTDRALDPKAGLNRLCGETDANGNAAVEVYESQSIHVNVIGDFAAEGLLRSIDVNFTTPTSTGGIVPSGDGSSLTSPDKTAGTTPPPASAVAQSLKKAATPLPKVQVISKAKLMMARLYTPVKGTHYLAVKVSSKAATARIQLKLTIKVKQTYIGKDHKRHIRYITKTKTQTLKVKANRIVKLTMASNVTKVSVKVLG